MKNIHDKRNPRLKTLRKRLIKTFLLILTVFTINAQTLQRKIDFGIDYMNLPGEGGIEVKNVFKDHMADKMGILPGDIIHSFGGIEVPHMGALLFWLDRKNIGDEIMLIIMRDGKRKILKGPILVKPYEQDPTVSYDAFEFKDGTIRTIVAMPQNAENVPVVFYIQDYSCLSMDYAGRPYEFVRKLSQDFVNHGYAFVRVEKHEVGDSRTEKNCMQVNFEEEGLLYKSAMKYIRNLDNINNKRIIVLAHGMGGNHLLNVVKDKRPFAAVLWGYYVHFNNEACRPLRSENYWKEIDKQKDHNKWKGLGIPTLFLHPEHDGSDNEGKEAKALSEFLTKQHLISVYRVFEGSNHLFQAVQSSDVPEMFLDGYLNPDFFEKNFDHRVVPAIIQWVESLKAK